MNKTDETYRLLALLIVGSVAKALFAPRMSLSRPVVERAVSQVADAAAESIPKLKK